MRKLFTKDNLLKSVKELFIVFLGVLLALVGENFVQSANDRALEKEYLTELLGELDISVSVAIGDRRRIHTVDSSAMVLIGMIKNDRVLSQDCHCDPCWLINQISGVIEPDIYKSIYEDIKSTGNIKVISNSRLRQEIVMYYERTIYLEKWSRDIRNNLFPFYSKQLIAAITAEEFYGKSPCANERVIKRINQKEVIDDLNNARIMARENGAFLDERIRRTQEIMKSINEELSRK